jgi:hypothetical protein
MNQKAKIKPALSVNLSMKEATDENGKPVRTGLVAFYHDPETGRLRGSISQDVAAIKLADGTVLKRSKQTNKSGQSFEAFPYYVNMWANEDIPQTELPGKPAAKGAFTAGKPAPANGRRFTEEDADDAF